MDQENEFNKHHGCTIRGEYRHSGFPQKNQASIYAYFKKPSDAEEFDTFIGSKNYEYDDSEIYYEYTQGYGKKTITTTICDKFYRKYNGKIIDYYIARADDGGKENIKCHKVRVVGKYRRPNGKWALKLKLPRLN